MSGGEFVGWVFMTSLSLWATGFCIGCVVRILSE
jgi:hypothetical protein